MMRESELAIKINRFMNDFYKYAPQTYRDWDNKTQGNIQQARAFATYFQTYNVICDSSSQASIEKFFVKYLEFQFNCGKSIIYLK